MKDTPIRVLHVVAAMDMGGMESRTMDIYRAIDRERIQFDFLVRTEKEGFFDEEIRSLGGVIHRTDSGSGKDARRRRIEQTEAILRENAYAIAHFHVSEASRTTLELAAAFRRCGVATVCVHARSSSVTERSTYLKHLAMRGVLRRRSTDWFAVSGEAGRWIFGRRAVDAGRVKIVKNAIPVERFRFSQDARDRARAALGLGDALVIGRVSRFAGVKNTEFLLRVFRAVREKVPGSRLLLVGDGPLLEEAKAQARALGVEQATVFFGQSGNASDLYQAMDCFCLPSLFEGMPGTALEAQAAGLPCVISDTVTREAEILPETKYLSLSEPPERWAEELVARAKTTDREAGAGHVRAAGYDMRDAVWFWTEFYLRRVQ